MDSEEAMYIVGTYHGKERKNERGRKKRGEQIGERRRKGRREGQAKGRLMATLSLSCKVASFHTYKRITYTLHTFDYDAPQTTNKYTYTF